MKVVYCTYRYGALTNDTYHCASVEHAGEVLHMYGCGMDTPPPGAVPVARQTSLTVVVGDSYSIFDCDDSCEIHN